MSNTDLGLFVADGKTAFCPGELLELSVLWALPAAPSSMEVRLFWFTRGKGTEDVEIVSTERISANEVAGETKVRFTLPAAPYSFSGKLISLIWAAELVVEPGARSARCEFVMGPEGKEVMLHDPAHVART